MQGAARIKMVPVELMVRKSLFTPNWERVPVTCADRRPTPHQFRIHRFLGIIDSSIVEHDGRIESTVIKWR